MERTGRYLCRLIRASAVPDVSYFEKRPYTGNSFLMLNQIKTWFPSPGKTSATSFLRVFPNIFYEEKCKHT